MWKEKEDLAGATSGIGINQQVDLESNKWKKVMQQVERRKMQQVEKGNATSGKEKNVTGVFWQILELVCDTGD